MKKPDNQKLPEFVNALFMVCMDHHVIHPNVPDASSVIQTEEMKIAVFLHQCQKVYERNMVLESDALVVEFEEGFRLMFHENHVCLHHKEAKIGHFPAPLGVNAVEIAQEYLRVAKFEPEV